jgi:large subunit ribosomal protein L18e
MLRIIRKKNPELHQLMVALRKASQTHDAPVWGEVARRLGRSRHQVYPLNVEQVERLAKPTDVIVVPGKLLAEGRLTKPVTVAAFRFSESAKTKIHSAGGTAVSIDELLKALPKGTGVRLLA